MAPTSYGETFARITGPTGAPPLVLLHGAGATSLMWAPNVRALSAACRTVAVDQMGEFGRSTCAKPLPTMSDQLAWLNELFDALELGNVINLVGISYGGAMAAQYALHHPERLNKLVLLAPGATVLRTTTQFMVRMTFALLARRRGFLRLFRWIFADMARKDPNWIEETTEVLLRGMGSQQRHKVPFPPVLTDAEWAALKVPVLFLVGEHEKIYSAEKAVRRLKRVAPQVRAEIIAGAGHDLSFVQAETVNRTILEFLQQEPAASTVNSRSHASA